MSRNKDAELKRALTNESWLMGQIEFKDTEIERLRDELRTVKADLQLTKLNFDRLAEAPDQGQERLRAALAALQEAAVTREGSGVPIPASVFLQAAAVLEDTANAQLQDAATTFLDGMAEDTK